MPEPTLLERIWWGDGALPAVARTALAPLARGYGGVVALRGALYDHGLLRSHELALPALSVGNLTVGGTGKTPVAAWLAGELRRRGARPAVVLRGYGGDEILVHERLNPGVLVVAAPDRVAGVAQARALGADVAVLDDAFQHRRARRLRDLVLVSADRWDGAVRLLPAGPWREPLRAAARASLVLVTRKAAAPGTAQRVVDAVRAAAPSVPVAVALLAPDALHAADGTETRPLESLAGARVHAVAAIGDPRAFLRQLEAIGARVTATVRPDHHAFTAADVDEVSSAAAGSDAVVCTLKDAVKLAPLWRGATPALWYVSQRIVAERGGDALASLLDDLLRARYAHRDTAGSAPAQ